jgi:hypothetical protein
MIPVAALCAMFAATPAVAERVVRPNGAASAAVQNAANAEKAVRLRLGIACNQTSDFYSGRPGDTDDELYYYVVEPAQGNTIKVHEKRRLGDPNIWRMGPETESRLARILAEGNVSAAHPGKLAVIIAEQDNQQANGLETKYWPGGAIPNLDPSLKRGVDEALGRIRGNDHQLLLTAQITVMPGSISVSTTVPRVVDDPKAPKFGHAQGYFFRFAVEDASEPRPKGRDFLSTEDDDCQPNNSLAVHTGPGTLVDVPKGESAFVSIPNRRFGWTCGGTEEHATCPEGTNEIEVVRHNGNDTVLWNCAKRINLTPDVTF